MQAFLGDPIETRCNLGTEVLRQRIGLEPNGNTLLLFKFAAEVLESVLQAQIVKNGRVQAVRELANPFRYLEYLRLEVPEPFSQ